MIYITKLIISQCKHWINYWQIYLFNTEQYNIQNKEREKLHRLKLWLLIVEQLDGDIIERRFFL